MTPTLEAWKIIEALSITIENTIAELQSDIEPDVVDTRDEGSEDDYQPSMHNQHPGGGKRYPGLDPRWVAIGYTDLQKGILALKNATRTATND